MEIIKFKNKQEYIKLINELYKNDSYCKDNKSDVINMICDKKSIFFKNSKQEMIGILSNSVIKCQAVLIQHKNLPNTLIVSFFEAYPDSQKEVDCLIDYLKTKAVAWNCKKILIGINGHCNYGLGILNSNFNEVAEFGEAYNPHYYKYYFENTFKIHKFYSYKNSLLYTGEQINKSKNKLNNTNISFERYNINSKNFDDIVKIYTDLNNEIFKDHLYYYKREYEEDIELFKSMKPLLIDQNLIIAFKEEKPIGFLFWYPNFNELANINDKVNLFSVLKYKLLNKKPKKIMLTEIGVLPEYEKSGLIVSLFFKVYDYLYNKYDKNCIVCSGWIYDNNLKSKKLVEHMLKEKSKEFCLYELAV